jgi:hypothetical protein
MYSAYLLATLVALLSWYVFVLRPYIRRQERRKAQIAKATAATSSSSSTTTPTTTSTNGEDSKIASDFPSDILGFIRSIANEFDLGDVSDDGACCCVVVFYFILTLKFCFF